MSQTKAQLIDPVDGTIVNADINASAAIAASKIADFVTGNVNNRVLTASGTANSLVGESGLLFTSDSNDHALTLTGSGQAHLRLTSTSGSDHCSIDFGDSDDNDIGEIRYTNSTNSMHFDTNANLQMTLDSSGRLLLGTSTEGQSSADDLTIATSANTGITIRSGTSNTGNVYFSDGTSSTAEFEGFIEYDHSSNFLRFGTAATERFRVDNSGDFLVATTSDSIYNDSSGGGFNLKSDGQLVVAKQATSAADPLVWLNDTGQTTNKAIVLAQDGTERANVGLASNDVTVTVNGSERLRINSSGMVGIGTTDVRGQLQIGSGLGGGNVPTNDELVFGANGSVINFLSANDNASVDGVIGAWNTVYNHQNSKIVFDKNAGNVGQILFFTQNGSGIAEYMRLTNSGSLFINTTSAISAGVAGAEFHQGNNAELRCGTTGTGNSTQIRFYNANGEVGAIRTNGTATVYHTSSDYRRKENAVAISDGITRLKNLKPYRFNFKGDSSTILDGFFAHEVSSVVPEAIVGTKDEVVTQAHVDSGEKKESELGDPIYQGIDQSKLVPLLVAAVKELITKVETLEAA